LNAPKWSDLAARKQSAEDRIRDVNTPGGEIPGLLEEKQAAVAEMEKNQIFIPTATLALNASAKWSTRWIRS
jgi:hypothetical protein